MDKPRTNSVLSKTLKYSDTRNCLEIVYSKSPRPSEVMTVQYTGATIAIDADGGASSKLLITLSESAVDQTGTATTAATHTFDGSTYTTLGALVKAINETEGFTCWLKDAPASLATNVDTFSDLAATAIPEAGSTQLGVLVMASHASDALYLRVGHPTIRDAGGIKLLSAITSITSTAGASIKLERDNGVDTAETLDEERVSATAKTAYLDAELQDAPTYGEGPFLFTFDATSLTGAELTVRYIPQYA